MLYHNLLMIFLDMLYRKAPSLLPLFLKYWKYILTSRKMNLLLWFANCKLRRIIDHMFCLHLMQCDIYVIYLSYFMLKILYLGFILSIIQLLVNHLYGIVMILRISIMNGPLAQQYYFCLLINLAMTIIQGGSLYFSFKRFREGEFKLDIWYFQILISALNFRLGTGEMVQWFEALVAFVKDLCSDPNILIVSHSLV